MHQALSAFWTPTNYIPPELSFCAFLLRFPFGHPQSVIGPELGPTTAKAVEEADEL